MERIPKELETSIKAATFYADDLSEIIAALALRSSPVSGKTDRYRYDNAGELLTQAIETRPSMLSLTTADRKAGVTLGRGGARIWTLEDDLASTGTYQTVMSIAKAANPWFRPRRWFAVPGYIIGGGALDLLFVRQVSWFGTKYHVQQFELLDTGLAILTVALFYLNYRYPYERAAIYLAVRRSDTNFIQRNWLGLIYPTLLAIGSALIGHYWTP